MFEKQKKFRALQKERAAFVIEDFLLEFTDELVSEAALRVSFSILSGLAGVPPKRKDNLVADLLIDDDDLTNDIFTLARAYGRKLRDPIITTALPLELVEDFVRLASRIISQQPVRKRTGSVVAKKPAL